MAKFNAEKLFTLWFLVVIGGWVLTVALTLAGLFVAAHFILKFW